MRLRLPRGVRTPPSVTVVVPCYNYGHFLPAMVESVLAQDDVDAHVIIVDDASPDGSAAVAQRLATAYPGRVSALLHEQNAGHIATYNDGLAKVETEYATLISADDLLAPGALGRATRLMQVNPRVGLVYGHTISFDSGTTPTPPHRPLPETWSIWRGHDWLRWSARRGRNFIMSPEVVMRTAALREVGGYNAELPHSGDLEYWLRTAALWDVARVNGKPQAYYRVHGGNMHLTSYATMVVDLRHRLAAFEVLARPDIRAVIPDAGLLERARRALAREAQLIATRDLDRGVALGDVRPLLEFAEELRPGSGSIARGRRLARRTARQRLGKPPSRLQRATEFTRGQADRVRGVLYEVSGIS